MAADGLVARLDQALEVYAPEYRRLLQPGANDLTIDALRRRYPSAPQTLIDLYRWHDGGPPGHDGSFFYNYQFSSIAKVLDTACMLDDLARDPKWLESPIQWNSGWLPFLDNGGGDNLCVDTADSLGLGSASVVRYDHEVEWRTVSAPTFDAWLEAFALTLQAGMWRLDESGNFVPAEEEGYRDGFQRWVSARYPGFPKSLDPPR